MRCYTVLTLIHKGGDVADWSTYRPIAVKHVLAKVFALVLNARLVIWSEEEGKRQPAQTGFRPGLNTSFNIFVLRHFIDEARAKKRKLFTCFVDFRKAYDTVPRDLIWKRLSELGVRGKMLLALKAMYANTQFTIKHNGQLGQPFQCNVGVRQGCPLSPLLFGIFIEQFADMVHREAPELGPLLIDGRVPLLFYADDLVLMADSAEKLQQLLDLLASFCQRTGMQVNLTKTQAVIFQSRVTKATLRGSYWQMDFSGKPCASGEKLSVSGLRTEWQ